jgi:TonB family protein
VQLAALVGAGALLAALLRLHAPLAALRFWQGILAISLLWPAYQLWAHTAAPSFTLAGQGWSSVTLWPSTSAASTIGLNPTLIALILATLAAGAVVRLVRIAAGVRKLRAIRATSTPASSLAPIAEPLKQRLGISADIRFTDAVTGPATFGAGRPTVLLPPQVNLLAPQVQRAILCHELLHVRRRDWLATIAEELWCAMLWFHPAARALAAQLSLARETLVDQETISCTGDRRAYAAALLECSTTGPRLAGASALIDRGGLERRIALITEEVHMAGATLAIRVFVAVFGIAAAILVATATLPMGVTVHAQAGNVYRPGPGSGVTLPQVVKEVKPTYTPQALQAKVQGSVWLTTIVLPDGGVGEVIVQQSLDEEHGLDEAAVTAVKQWQFKPGTKDGKPVPVEVTIEMTFTLEK